MLKHYKITIVMSDGSRGYYFAPFASACEAIAQILADFEGVRCISARRVQVFA